MKMLTAIIKPDKLDDVREALYSIGVQGLTTIEVKGFGRQKGHTEKYRGAEYKIDFLPKLMVMTAVKTELVEKAMRAIQDAARTGNIGDGKVFVTPIESALRIRTGETGEEVL